MGIVSAHYGAQFPLSIALPLFEMHCSFWRVHMPIFSRICLKRCYTTPKRIHFSGRKRKWLILLGARCSGNRFLFPARTFSKLFCKGDPFRKLGSNSSTSSNSDKLSFEPSATSVSIVSLFISLGSTQE